MTPKAKATNVKIDELDSSKLKMSDISKDTINRMKRQPMKWENFLNHISDKGIISMYIKNYNSTKNTIKDGQMN